MAIINDYTTLSDAVASYLNRSDLTTFVPNFIEAAEQLVYRKIEHRGVETAFTGVTTSGGVFALSGLTNFRSIKWIRTSAAGGGILKPLSIENLYEMFPNRSQAEAFPRHFARDAAELVFGPCAASGVALDGVYYALLPNLSASNTTNFFTSNAPEVLLFGALTQAEPFIVGDQRIPVWASLFTAAFDAVQHEGKRENRTGTSRVTRVV
jgi:hypothetical protein